MWVLALREHLALHKLARSVPAPSRRSSLSYLLPGLLWCFCGVDALSLSYNRHLQELPASQLPASQSSGLLFVLPLLEGWCLRLVSLHS